MKVATLPTGYCTDYLPKPTVQMSAFSSLFIEWHQDLGNLYNDRLESLENTSILNKEGDEENIIDNDENIDLDRAEELILTDDLNLDQSLRNALHSFKQICNIR
nr:6981_t:CDS:2 [Entrophospora candida]